MTDSRITTPSGAVFDPDLGMVTKTTEIREVHTEIGKAKFVNGVYTAAGSINLKDKPNYVFGHSNILTRYGVHSTSQSNYIVQPLPLLLSILLVKGWQIRLQFTDGADRIMVKRDDGHASFRAAKQWIGGGSNCEIFQAWSDVLIFKNGAETYYVPLKDIIKIEAYLSPLILIANDVDPVNKSVARLTAEVDAENIHYVISTGIRHVFHSLAASGSWRAYSDETNGLNVGFARIEGRRFGSAVTHIVTSMKEVAESLYCYNHSDFGQALYSLDRQVIDGECLMAIDASGYCQITDLRDTVGRISIALKAYAPKCYEHFIGKVSE